MGFASPMQRLRLSRHREGRAAPAAGRGTSSGEEATSTAPPASWTSSLERLQVKGHRAYPDAGTSSPATEELVPLARQAASANAWPACVTAPWQPPSCLHPTIGVSSPLTFDLVDTWMDRSPRKCASTTSCTPVGAASESFPVNAFEAEGRRTLAVLPHGPHHRPRRRRERPSLRRRALHAGSPAAPEMRSHLPRLLEYPLPRAGMTRCGGDSSPRPHWRAFFSQLSGMSEETLRDRERFLRQSIAADGVTYNIYADAQGERRPWDLDVLPLILPAAEWSEIAAGVAQRARLLDAVLADLLGPQALLAEGLVPPALVFGQLGYPWPAVGLRPPEGVFLHLYAADIARAPDGRFWILSDRTQAPSGAAYALQNRMTLARAFPDAFRELGVEPLREFFTALQDSLARLAPTRGEPPLVVLLTPARTTRPTSSTSFSLASSAFLSSRDRTSSSATTPSSSRPCAACAESTPSSAASTTTTAIRGAARRLGPRRARAPRRRPRRQCPARQRPRQRHPGDRRAARLPPRRLRAPPR
ncbi:MAG: transglutaminase family protein [Polyangiaceae bacterium]